MTVLGARGDLFAVSSCRSSFTGRGFIDHHPANCANQPWTLIGPVLAGEKPKPEVKLPEGFYEEWQPDCIYERGHRVMQEGIAYEAKWWTEAESPDKSLVDPGNAGWSRISEEEIIKLLDTDPTVPNS